MIGYQFSTFLVFIVQAITTFGQSAQNNRGNIVFATEANLLKLNSDCQTSENKIGICTKVHDCPIERFKLTRNDICYFEIKDPVVCCENFAVDIKTNDKLVNFNSSNADNTTSDLLTGERISLRHCNTNFTLDPSIFKVGGLLSFVGGDVSQPFVNPQMAAIGWRSFDGDVTWKCGGSLISLDFVITAAHCTDETGQLPEVVRVGDLNLLKDNDTLSQDFTIGGIWIHPEYERDLNYHDIALLKITPEARITDSVKPACLWPHHEISVTELTAMGYGTNAFAGRRTNELYEGKLKHVPNDECHNAFTSNRMQIPDGIIESQICAKDPEGKIDTCQGDSGGPLVIRQNELNPSNQFIVGITSFGESCAGQTPGVYTRISSYLDWIESIVWPSN